MSIAALVLLSVVTLLATLWIAVAVIPHRNEITSVMAWASVVMAIGLLIAALTESPPTDAHLLGGIVARGAFLLIVVYRAIRWR